VNTICASGTAMGNSCCPNRSKQSTSQSPPLSSILEGLLRNKSGRRRRASSPGKWPLEAGRRSSPDPIWSGRILQDLTEDFFLNRPDGAGRRAGRLDPATRCSTTPRPCIASRLFLQQAVRSVLAGKTDSGPDSRPVVGQTVG
jgi:hypothetical protein